MTTVARMDTTTDTDALDRADMAHLVEGDDLALNRLMTRHGPSVLRLLGYLVGNVDDARELAQETFARVYRARARYRPRERFKPWLFTIASNLGRNHLRWKSRHPALSLDAEEGLEGQPLGDTLVADGHDPRQAAVAADRIRAVRNAMGLLPAHMRQALVLCEWEDLPVAEAASVLRTTPKAVESLLYRARAQLRERLKTWR